jgi:hypothetical protein
MKIIISLVFFLIITSCVNAQVEQISDLTVSGISQEEATQSAF